MNEVLKLENLNVHIKKNKDIFKIVNNVGFSVKKERILGIVGESGCGKSITCHSIMGLLGKEFTVDGNVIFKDKNIVNMTRKEKRALQGKEMAMIMQNPMTAFNSIITIGEHFTETIQSHINISKKEAVEKALHWIDLMKLPNPKQIMESYPFELSGGMLQRVMIGIALSMNPSILIADEPTTALDATIQYEILSQIYSLKEKYKTSILLVSHDLGVIAQLADEVIVMYCGHIVEKAHIMNLFDNPLHPYTKALMNARPGLEKKRLMPIKGLPPSIMNLNNSCPFLDRCKESSDRCREYKMNLVEREKEHFVSCIKYI